MTTFHVDGNGALLRATSDPDAVVPGAVRKTTRAPESGRQTYDHVADAWSAPPVRKAPLTVEALRLELVAAGTLPADRP